MQLMRLELSFLHEIHDASDAGERERTVRHDRDRGMKLEPRVRWQLHRMPHIDRRKQSQCLNQKNKRRGECAHERKPICRPDQHVDQCDRPREKDQPQKKIRERAARKFGATNQKQRVWKKEPNPNRKKIKPPRPKTPPTKCDNRAKNRREKTNCRNNEKLS